MESKLRNWFVGVDHLGPPFRDHHLRGRERQLHHVADNQTGNINAVEHEGEFARQANYDDEATFRNRSWRWALNDGAAVYD